MDYFCGLFLFQFSSLLLELIPIIFWPACYNLLAPAEELVLLICQFYDFVCNTTRCIITIYMVHVHTTRVQMVSVM